MITIRIPDDNLYTDNWPFPNYGAYTPWLKSLEPYSEGVPAYELNTFKHIIKFLRDEDAMAFKLKFGL